MMTDTPKLKNKRLSNRDRDVIQRFAKKQIRATESTEKLDTSYEAVADAIVAAVEGAYPKKDMRVLQKYSVASVDSCIYVSVGGFGDYDRFEFRDGDKRAPIRPDKYCRNQPIMLEAEAGEVFKVYQSALSDFKSAIDARITDFNSLIYNTPSFNALADTWPALEALRGEIVGNSAALSVLSDDVVRRIKSDPALQVSA